ncbi:MAG: GAF domain-containing protein [Coriobacteriia bacterium]|nr:GAF domain-containing protein [Coriobacteriia bacterium]
MEYARAISLIIVGLVNVGLALAVYLRNRRSPANRAFALTVLASIAWLTLAFLSDLPQFSAVALTLNRLDLAMAIVMGGCLLYFTLVFPSSKRTPAWGWLAYMAVGGAIAIVTATTPLVVATVQSFSWGTSITPGLGMFVYSAWLIVGIGLLIAVLVRKTRQTQGREHAQLKYMMLGIGLFTVFSVVLGLVLPTFEGAWQLSILNTYTPLFLFGFTAYAMIKHRLMDMRLVVFRGVLYAVLVAILMGVLLVVAQFARTELASGLGLSADASFVIVGLALVFVFQPIRQSLENATERFFYRKRHDRQALMARLSGELAVTVDAGQIFAAVQRVLDELLKVDRASLVIAEADGLTVHGVLLASDEPGLADIMAISGGGHAILAEDLDDATETARMLAERQISAVVPLTSSSGVEAVLVLGGKRSGEAFSSQDARFLELLAPEISISLKTAELFEQRNQRVRELTALNRLASVLGQDIQLEALLRRALQQVIYVAGADGGSIMLYDSASRILTIEAAEGLSDKVIADTQVRLGEGISGWVAQHRKSLLLIDGAGTAFDGELKEQGLKSALSVPLIAKDRMIGVLNIDRSSSATQFSQPNLSVVASFAGQLAMAIDNARVYSDLEGHFLGTITALAAAVDAKDPYTFGHSSGVTDHAIAIAEGLGLTEHETETLRKAAILHDIGKIGIDGSILNKPGPLDAGEREIMQQHPSIGANILGSLDFLEDVVPIVFYHHEHYDGHGYPAGMAGEDIPLGARIISVADAFNAMTSDRPYRSALGLEQAARELERNAGTQFDPRIVDVFLQILARSASASSLSAHVGQAS